ncbi:hypothetical protein ACTMTI_05535 [Nonomuraea sp. H19]|uniref:hypothetical protein n=1 Tax=Nonomuraea sp. H19 TaxID=3452206 RepID=UPI003F886970
MEALRCLRIARRSAVDQRQMKALIVTAPDGLRAQLRGLPAGKLVHEPMAASTNPTTDPTGTVMNWPMPRAMSTANRACSKPSPRTYDRGLG